MTTPDPLPQLTADTRALVTEVERLTGLTSRWSGTAVISTQRNAIGRPAYFGGKAWNCDIVIHQSRLAHPGKYTTLVHEVFHSVSQGLNQTDFDLFTGYEEGVVESCTRLFCQTVLSAASLPFSASVRTSYNAELALLEDLRMRTQQQNTRFYLGLLAMSLSDREEVVLQWIQNAAPAKTRQQIMQETFSVRAGLKL